MAMPNSAPASAVPMNLSQASQTPPRCAKVKLRLPMKATCAPTTAPKPEASHAGQWPSSTAAASTA